MEKKEEKFDWQEFEKEALKKLKAGLPLEGKEGILAPMIKRIVEASLEGELAGHLEEGEVANRRNGKKSKDIIRESRHSYTPRS